MYDINIRTTYNIGLGRSFAILADGDKGCIGRAVPLASGKEYQFILLAYIKYRTLKCALPLSHMSNYTGYD